MLRTARCALAKHGSIPLISGAWTRTLFCGTVLRCLILWSWPPGFLAPDDLVPSAGHRASPVDALKALLSSITFGDRMEGLTLLMDRSESWFSAIVRFNVCRIYD